MTCLYHQVSGSAEHKRGEVVWVKSLKLPWGFDSVLELILVIMYVPPQWLHKFKSYNLFVYFAYIFVCSVRWQCPFCVFFCYNRACMSDYLVVTHWSWKNISFKRMRTHHSLSHLIHHHSHFYHHTSAMGLHTCHHHNGITPLGKVLQNLLEKTSHHNNNITKFVILCTFMLLTSYQIVLDTTLVTTCHLYFYACSPTLIKYIGISICTIYHTSCVVYT